MFFNHNLPSCFQNSKLSDWFVSLAHATSHDLWLEACQAYANQLIKDDDILKGEDTSQIYQK
jgi:hypothetical protein